MEYRNKRSGNIISVPSPVDSPDWEEVGKAEKSGGDEPTNADIKKELDALDIKYKANANKDTLKNLLEEAKKSGGGKDEEGNPGSQENQDS